MIEDVSREQRKSGGQEANKSIKKVTAYDVVEQTSLLLWQ